MPENYKVVCPGCGAINSLVLHDIRTGVYDIVATESHIDHGHDCAPHIHSRLLRTMSTEKILCIHCPFELDWDHATDGREFVKRAPDPLDNTQRVFRKKDWTNPDA